MNIKSLVNLIKQEFADAANPEDALQKTAYFKDQFEFFGLKANVWVPITKAIFKEQGLLKGKDLLQFVELCFDDDHREMHYAAVQMIEKSQKKFKEDICEVLDFAMRNNQWWDTIDWLAKLWGIQFQKFPEYNPRLPDKWIQSDNFWHQRTAIIFQLFYKEKTNSDQLFSYILKVANSREFFLQKAAGWALRQYSKTDPDAVKEFINSNELSKLTIREGLRLMK